MRRCVARGAWLAPVMLLVATGASQAQSLEQRVAAAPDGAVRFTFAARPGVRGDGDETITWECGDHGDCGRRDSRSRYACEAGPVRVTLTVRERTVQRVRVAAGSAWRSAPSGTVTDLGTVAAHEAAEYLIALARRAPANVGKEAVFAAALADSVTVWPDLLTLARESRVPRDTRRAAVLWVGQAAEAAATAGLEEFVYRTEGQQEVVESAVFALSQRPTEEGVPALLKVAQTHGDPAIRRQAIFWLAQKDDPRVLAYFEEVLTKP